MNAISDKTATSASSLRNLLKALGPGLLVACAAIGGSHLVWSTRAGAEFGWALVWIILLTNLLKFPFFLYGQSYTAATGESLLAGYLRLGRRYVVIFLTINLMTGVINIAGVAMLSAALFSAYGLFEAPLAWVTVGLLAVSAALVLFGHYRLLDGMAKAVIVTLGLCTIFAVILAARQGPVAIEGFESPELLTWASFALVIAVIGWMPAPIDLSAWSSLWMFSREKQTGHFATPRETAVDFYIGYAAAVVMAVLFVALGALVMYGSGQRFDDSGIAFSNQLINLYAANIGDWSRPLILTAAFITMFSTTLTCIDGYPRSLAACCRLLSDCSVGTFQWIHRILLVLSVVFAMVTVLFFVRNLIQLLTFAAVISFLTSPVLAWINLRVMNGANVPEAQRPGPLLSWLSWIGLGYFAVMIAGYLLYHWLGS